jgi:hypothetical protein
LLALLGGATIVDVSRLRVNVLVPSAVETVYIDNLVPSAVETVYIDNLVPSAVETVYNR